MEKRNESQIHPVVVLTALPVLLPVFLLIMCSIPVFGQKNKLVVVERQGKKSEYYNSSKATILINSTESLLFKSSKSQTVLPVTQSGDQYKLTLDPGPVVITAETDGGLYIKLNFTRDDLEEEAARFRELKAGETRCFTITSEFQLEWNIGNGNPEQIHPGSYALVIIRLEPKTLPVSFSSIENDKENVIRVIDTSSVYGRYWVCMKPGARFLNVHIKSYLDVQLRFDPLKVYPVLYYKVTTPDTMGSYYFNSDPQGAFIRIKGLENFNKENNKTPFLIKQKCGTYDVSLEHDKYNPVHEIIKLCDRSKSESSFKLTAGYAKIQLNVNPDLKITHVYSDEKILFPAHDNVFELKKGFNDLILVAPRYTSDTLLLDLTRDTTITRNLRKVSGPGVLFFTNPKKVRVTIQPDWKFTGRSPFHVKLSPGTYNVLVENPLYRSEESTLKVNPNEIGYSFTLKPYSYPMTFKLKGRAEKTYKLYIDDVSSGKFNGVNQVKRNVPAGIHNVKILTDDNDEVVFNGKIKQENHHRKKVIWLPSNLSWSAFSFGYTIPFSYFTHAVDKSFKAPAIYQNPGYSLNVSAFSFFGFTITPVQVETINTPVFPDKPYIFSWGNPEYRLGLSLTNWLDFSLFISYSYKTNPLLKTELSKPATDFVIQGYKYGMAFNVFTHSRYRWAWVSMTIRVGVRDEMITYHIWDGAVNLPANTVRDYNAFVSVSLNLLTVGDGMVLRIFKKPLTHSGAF